MTWAYRLEGPVRFARHDVPRPATPAAGEVLLRFEVGGICGSDLPRVRDGAGTGGPEPYGWSLHEIVGEVVEGEGDLRPGGRVVGWVGDSTGLREYVATPATMLHPVPDGLDGPHAVVLQPLACVLHATARLPDVSGARVAVIGLGPIGLLFAHVLAGRGARVTGIDAVDRGAVAGAFGLDEVVTRGSWAWARGLPRGGAFDLVVEAVGHQVGTVEHAVVAAAPGATVLCFGNPDDAVYPVPFGMMMDKGLTLHTGRTPRPERRRALALAVDYAARHRAVLDDVLTHVLPVEQAEQAFRLAARPAEGQLKIVLDAGR